MFDFLSAVFDKAQGCCNVETSPYCVKIGGFTPSFAVENEFAIILRRETIKCLLAKETKR